jgi:hypothetical protein
MDQNCVRPVWDITWKDYALTTLTFGAWAMYKQDTYMRSDLEFKQCIADILRKDLYKTKW